MLTNFWEDDATRQPLATVGEQQTNAPGGRCGYVAPRQIGHEFVTGGEADALLDEHMSPEAAARRGTRALADR